MSTDLIVILAVVIGAPLVIAILFKTLWKVPRADEALIVTGSASRARRRAAPTSRSGRTGSRPPPRPPPARRSRSSPAAARS